MDEETEVPKISGHNSFPLEFLGHHNFIYLVSNFSLLKLAKDGASFSGWCVVCARKAERGRVCLALMSIDFVAHAPFYESLHILPVLQIALYFLLTLVLLSTQTLIRFPL